LAGIADQPLSVSKIGSNVACLIDAKRAGDTASWTRCASNGLAEFDGQLLELQLHIRAGVDPNDIDDAVFGAFDGRGGVRGIDTMIAWLDPLRLPALVAAEPRIAFAQMPQRPILELGKVQSQGATLLHQPKMMCTGRRGYGQTVAVVDSGFQDLDKSIKNKEVTRKVGKVSYTGGFHGTMCAEVVADVAPGARIYPVATPSFPYMQNFIAEVTGPNKYSVDIVSHSVGWLGMSFGRHTGPLCALTDKARAAGIAWVNAAGNNGGGNFYQSAYVDEDKDGNHDVLPGEPKLMFRLGHNARVQVYFDWDDYEKAKINLDLQLFRQEKSGFWKLVTYSGKTHNMYTGASEILFVKAVPAGIYAFVMRPHKGSANPNGVRLRILNKSTKSTPLSVHHKNGNVYDPASCKDVLAVGALRHNLWKKGPLETYSSYGPTADGRQKPEIMAPTGVATTKGAFFGTSASCPHAAGAVAVYAEATEGTALDVIDALIEDAEPMGVEHPDVAYGWGRLRLSAARLGWECDPEGIELPASCTTTCGTVGRRWCSDTCGWHKCVPPWETCNGIDDDCDGLTDEEPECQPAPADEGPEQSDTVSADVDAGQADAGSVGGGDDADGCSASRTGGRSSALWLLLVFVGGVVFRRKRSSAAPAR